MRDDLFDALRTAPPAGDPMPAAEVRRRGDRLRRRRTALQAVAAAVVVAVIAGGAVTLADRLGPSAAPPVDPPNPTDTVPGIPGDFPLANGWPKPSEEQVREALPAPAPVTPCEAEVALPEPVHWRGLGTSYVGSGQQRQLFVYASAADAQRVLDQLRAAAEGCRPGTPTDESVTRTVTEASRVDGGVRQLFWQELREGGPAVGLGVLQVFRTGSAVLVSTLGNEGGGRTDALAQAEADRAQVQPALAAMCRWTTAGCGPEEPAGGEAPRIRDDFPLTAGWQEPGGDGSRTEPGREVPAAELYACGTHTAPSGGDRLTATQTIGSTGWVREVRTYPTPADAERALATLREAFTDCRGWPDENGATNTAEVRPVNGGQGFQQLVWGAQAYTGATTVVLQGRALLVASTGNEATGRARAVATADLELDELAPVLAAMCAFTEAGCAGQPSGSLPDDVLLTSTDLADVVAGRMPADEQALHGGRWPQVADRDNPTLDCQASSLSSFDPLGLRYREWGRDGVEAATAVLSFADPAEARRRYDELRQVLQDCPAAMPGARSLEPAGELLDAEDGAGNRKATRVFTAAAPEACTQCDTGWIDAQGVVQVDDTVVVLSIAVRGDLQFVENKSEWIQVALDAAAARLP